MNLLKKIYYNCKIKWLEFEYNEILSELKNGKSCLGCNYEELKMKLKINRNILANIKNKLCNL